MTNLKILAIAVTISILPLAPIYPSQAQVSNVRQLLNRVPTSRVTFARGTVGTVIQGATNQIYLLNARKGQTLSLKVNSLGARASIVVYGVDGKPMTKVLNGFEDEGREITLELPRSGDYYIQAYAGPTNHFYDFTVRIE